MPGKRVVDGEADGRTTGDPGSSAAARSEVTGADPGPLRRLRGVVVGGIRRRVGAPIQRRIPLDVARVVHRARRTAVPARYTDADPFRVVAVDPARVETSILETTPRYPQWGRVQGGDWDRAGEPFADRPVARAIAERFEEGRPWRETPLHDHFADQLRRFGNAWGHTSMAGFADRCATIERLYESVRTDGYRPQRDVASAGGPWGDPVSPFDEINVDVGRSGDLLWRAYGQHRLAIAQLLGVDRVPVLVHRRHREWQRVRDSVGDGGRESIDDGGRDSIDDGGRDSIGDGGRDSIDDRAGVPRTHPDLRDLLEDDPEFVAANDSNEECDTNVAERDAVSTGGEGP